MAKKFGRFLLFSASVCAVAAGTYYYLQKKNARIEEDDDDFDDFDEYDDDLEDEDEDEDDTERTYVSLNLDNAGSAAPESKPEASGSADPQPAVSRPEEKVEEFFDDEDPSLDAM